MRCSKSPFYKAIEQGNHAIVSYGERLQDKLPGRVSHVNRLLPIQNKRVPYRRKFSRHEKFTKSLKTGFSRLFIRETTPDIRELHANVFLIKLYIIRSIIANVH